MWQSSDPKTFPGLDAGALWHVCSDVGGWPAGDEALERPHCEGRSAAGTRFSLKPQAGLWPRLVAEGIARGLPRQRHARACHARAA